MAITFKEPKTTEEKIKIEKEIEEYKKIYAKKHAGKRTKRMKTVFVLREQKTGKIVGNYTIKELSMLLGKSKDYTSRLANNVADGIRPYLRTSLGACYVERYREERLPDE